MSTTYAGADIFPATITVLDDGDPASASSFAPALEGLADRTKYLQGHASHRFFDFKQYNTESPTALFTASAPASNWSTNATLSITLPADTLAEFGSALLTDRDIIEARASVMVQSDGTGDVWVGLGVDGPSPQVWADSIRKVTSTSLERVELSTVHAANGLPNDADNPIKVCIFIFPQGSDDGHVFGYGSFSVHTYRKA